MPMRLQAEGRWFKDEAGRAVILRGLDLRAAPPDEEADQHFHHLKRRGLNFLRLAVTWKTLEHEGPGIYDQAAIDRIAAFIEQAGERDISLLIAPCSGFSSRDSAPDWTLETAGLDTAALRQADETWANPFAALTLFTLFFGGNAFAPQLTAEGQSQQDFLQTHYIQAFQHLAKRVAHLPHVIGFSAMNEPQPGLIGLPDLRGYDHARRKTGIIPTPAEAVFLANGFPQRCADFGQPRKNFPTQPTQAALDPQGRRIWQAGHEDIWRRQGIWDTDKDGNPRLLRPGHFSRADFSADCLKPFTLNFADAIREVMPTAHIFIETPPGAPPPCFDESDRLVFAPRFDDERQPRPTLHRRADAQPIGQFRALADERMGGAPVLVAMSNVQDEHGAALAALDDRLLNYTYPSSDIPSGENMSTRPYAKKIAGEPLNMRFDSTRGLFTFSFRHDSAVSEPTEIHVPNAPFPNGWRVEVSDGDYEIQHERQRVIYRRSDKDMPHMIRIISNTPPPRELSPYDKLALIGAVMLLTLTLLARIGRRIRGKDK